MSEETRKADPGRNMSREERLAAKLRENLRRRKAQARQMTESDGETLSNPRNDS